MPDLVTRASWMSDALLWWFAETTLVASALAVLAALAARVRWITPGPAARHAVWLMVMVKLVTPPLVHWPWSVPSPVASEWRDASPTSHNAGLPGNSGPIFGVIEEPVDETSLALASDLGAVSKPESEIPSDPEPGEAAHLRNWAWPALPRGLGPGLVAAWLIGSVTIGVGQARRIARFRGLLAEAMPAPDWLEDEAERVGRLLRVDVPPILVVPRLATPLLWCLGRPVLLVPEGLLKTLEADRWRAIVAHELAHLRRGDHWVRRVELAAGLVWWWSPLYWLARRRLDFEAELASDAWAVWASADGRLSYAESLIRICTTLSATESPAPALGVAGTGRSFERRLTMILHDRVDRRVSAPSLMAAAILAALALPSWTMADQAGAEDTKTATDEPVRVDARVNFETRHVPVVTQIELIEPIAPIFPIVTDDDDPEADDAKSKEKAKAKAAKLKAERAEVRAKKEAADREMAEKFGPDSEFAKKMETMSKEIEKKFGPGSDFAKKMEDLGKEMEEKFGPGSDFANEIEKKFGPDSAFVKEIEKKFGPGSEFAKQMKELGGEDGDDDPEADAKKAKLKAELKAKAKVEVDKARAVAARSRADAAKVRAEARASRPKPEPRPEPKVEIRVKKAEEAPEKQARQIEDLESRIEELMREVKQLKAEKSRGEGAGRP